MSAIQEVAKVTLSNGFRPIISSLPLRKIVFCHFKFFRMDVIGFYVLFIEKGHRLVISFAQSLQILKEVLDTVFTMQANGFRFVLVPIYA